jgi:ankyrin repeat protein
MRGYLTEYESLARQKTIASLLNAGANPNATNTFTRLTCIHWAAYYTNDAESLKLLITKTTLENVFTLDYKMRTSLDIAGMKSLNDFTFFTLDYLLECAEKYFNENHKRTPEQTEIEIQGIRIKSKLEHYTIEEKLYLDMLYWASYRDKTSFVIKLIKFGISPFVAFTMRENALISGVKGGAYKTVKAIIELKYELKAGSGTIVRICICFV